MQFAEEMDQIKEMSKDFNMPYCREEDMDFVRNLQENFNPSGLMP